MQKELRKVNSGFGPDFGEFAEDVPTICRGLKPSKMNLKTGLPRMPRIFFKMASRVHTRTREVLGLSSEPRHARQTRFSGGVS